MADSGWADWLRARLAEKEWTPAELARRSGVNDALISKWLDHKVTPSLKSIRAACTALGVPPVDGMIAAGHLEPDDVGSKVVYIERPLSSYHPAVLLEHVARYLVEYDAGSPEDETSDTPAAKDDARTVRRLARTERGTRGVNWAARPWPEGFQPDDKPR